MFNPCILDACHEVYLTGGEIHNSVESGLALISVYSHWMGGPHEAALVIHSLIHSVMREDDCVWGIHWLSGLILGATAGSCSCILLVRMTPVISERCQLSAIQEPGVFITTLCLWPWVSFLPTPLIFINCKYYLGEKTLRLYALLKWCGPLAHPRLITNVKYITWR